MFEGFDSKTFSFTRPAHMKVKHRAHKKTFSVWGRGASGGSDILRRSLFGKVVEQILLGNDDVADLFATPRE